ncbi:hypothetical protein [Mucilaginibacter oryzae]|uniref:hypothetical protein n=1 Tax=Mucilaginibacter oryzae TaxID=468058 RepID=UPI0011B256D6|nr:hypothetical protein [Mucilaginibacter oryzae]
METELLKLLLPFTLVEQFELIRIEPQADGYHLFLDQRNLPRVSMRGTNWNPKDLLIRLHYGIFRLGAELVFFT